METDSKSIGIYIRRGAVDTIVNGDKDTFTTLKVDESFDKPQQIIEEVVYSTPSMITDYSSVDVIVGSDKFMIVPQQITADRDGLSEALINIWPDVDASLLVVDNTFAENAVVTLHDAPFLSFVSRTFHNSRIINRLAVLVDFFSSQSRPVNRVKLYANIAEDCTLDIVVLTADTLLLANTYHCTNIDDVFYFIMAAVKDSGFDTLDDELLLYGHLPHCNKLTETLRKYVNSVMPLLLTDNQKSIPLELQYENNQR